MKSHLLIIYQSAFSKAGQLVVLDIISPILAFLSFFSWIRNYCHLKSHCHPSSYCHSFTPPSHVRLVAMEYSVCRSIWVGKGVRKLYPYT